MRNSQDVHKKGGPQVAGRRMSVTVGALVRKMPARNFYLVRDRVQSKKRSKRRGEKLSRVFPFRQDFMARAERSNIVITDVLTEGIKLAAKVLF